MKVNRLLSPIYLIVLASLVFWNNPRLFNGELLFDPDHPSAHQLFPIVHASVEEAAEQPTEQPTHNYRFDSSRSAFDDRTNLTKLKPRKIWSIDEFNLGIHGASKASAAVDDSGIFIGSDAGVFSHFGWEGQKRWSWWIAHHVRGIHSTAALSDKAVYFGAYNGKLYKLEKSSGRPLWTVDLGDAIGASPLLLQDALYVLVETSVVRDGYLVKLDPLSGKVIWRSPKIGEQSHSSPAYSPDRGALYFGANNGRFFSVDSSDGKINWSIETRGEVKSTPVLIENLVCYTDWGAGFDCIDLDSGRITARATLEGLSQVSPSYSAKHGALFTGDSKGFLHAFKTGGPQAPEVLWKNKVAEGNMMGSPLLFRVKDRLHLVGPCEKTSWCIWEASPFRRVFKSEAPGRLSGAPALHDDKLVLSFDYPGGIEVWSL
jgi:outer membrane protein assembly factor BamB